MKQIITTFFALLMAVCLWAQAPQAFNYQAVIRYAEGNLLENQAVGIKISLLQGSATGQEVYAETHATTTNQFGQVDLKIGTGTVVSGQFDTIAWGAGPYYLQLAVDLTGGSNYAIMGTTQMLSVPYALYAEEGSGWENTEKGISFMEGNVGIGTIDPNVGLSICSPNFGAKLSFKSNINSRDVIFGHDQNGAYIDLYSGDILYINSPTYGNKLVLKSEINEREFIFGHDELGGYFQSSAGDDIHFRNSVGNNIFVLKTDGNIGIGTTNPTYPLTVNGTIRSKKVIVDTGWSDFVFEDDYSLMPLHQLDKFIEENKHLPEIPSAKEVEENGVSLGEISASLLQKIEELTLYVIALKKENENQSQLIEEQSKQLKKLEKRRNR